MGASILDQNTDAKLIHVPKVQSATSPSVENSNIAADVKCVYQRIKHMHTHKTDKQQLFAGKEINTCM